MWKAILKWVLSAWNTGKYKAPKYQEGTESRTNGHFVNRGTKERERWVWIEPTSHHKSYICIHEIDGDYFISKRTKPSGNALEWVECFSPRDEKRAIRILVAGYEKRGNLILAVED